VTDARAAPAVAPPSTAATPFTDDQVHRYARHILLGEVGGTGQAKLLASKVLVIGAGGLGSPISMYLAAAGVGTLGIVDDDVVDLSNLQRQIVHATASVGTPKVDSARATLAAINPDVAVIAHRERITAANALRLIADYDVVADGSDNFPTRFLVNDACFFAKKPLVSGAVLRFDGQISTFKAFVPSEETAPGDKGGGDGSEHGPCYRCLFREPPPPGQIPSCAEAGVLGAFCGLVGSLQATEVLKELLGIGESLSGQLMVCDALTTTFRKIKVRRDPGCPLCGDAPSITDLSSHDA
jgi:adenylyltransferase/sulfurtransferase